MQNIFSTKFLLLTIVALSFIATASTLATPSSIQAQHNTNVYMFWGDGCPHCKHAKEVIEPHIANKPSVSYHNFEVYFNKKNQKKMQLAGETLDIEASGVPLIIVGDTAYTGFSDTTGKKITQRIDDCVSNGCPDSLAPALNISSKNQASDQPNKASDHTPKKDESIITLPIFGDINTAHVSLPLLTFIIALLDGFNPCAMWALLFIITLLLGMKDRKRMWLYGTTFIAVSAIAYFLFMVAWLNFFLFVGHVTWIRVAIGILAAGVGIYYLYDWCKKKGICSVSNNAKRQKTFAKLRSLVKKKNIWIGLIGIALLAAAVNIVELACSAGLPVLYTGILSSAGLETWQYYAYMIFYTFIFMLDDLIVFVIAMTTFKLTGIESKYTRSIRLVGGIVMIILGALLLFAPQLLMFG